MYIIKVNDDMIGCISRPNDSNDQNHVRLKSLRDATLCLMSTGLQGPGPNHQENFAFQGCNEPF